MPLVILLVRDRGRTPIQRNVTIQLVSDFAAGGQQRVGDFFLWFAVVA